MRIGVGVIGAGTVGGGVIKALQTNHDQIAHKAGVDPSICPRRESGRSATLLTSPFSTK